MQPSPNVDHEHLRLLSIFHYVVGGLTAAFSLFPLIHVGLGLFFVIAGNDLAPSADGSSPVGLGWLFLIMGTLIIVFGMTLAVWIILSGRYLAKRTHYYFSFVVACFLCLSAPLGTILGVFTIIVLLRPSVKLLYH
jgi:hypothetical protein